MAREELSSVHYRLWVLVILLLGCLRLLQDNETIVGCDHFRGESSSSSTQSVSEKDVFRTTNSSKDKLFQETRETHGPETEMNQGQSQGRQSRRQPGCTCQCRMSDRVKAGRYKVRPCRLQWKLLFSPVSKAEYECSVPLSPSGTSEVGKRSRKLHSASWTVDSSPNARGQAKRNRLRCPDLLVDLAGHSLGSLRGGCGARHVHDRLLMSASQRQESRGSGKGSVLGHVLVSLLAACLLFQGDRPEQKTVPGLKERLLCLLRECASVGRRQRWDEEIQALMSCSSVRFLSPGSSFKSRKFSFRWKKAAHSHNFSRSRSKSSCAEFPYWCFNTNLLVTSTHLWVAPATQFLPGMTSQGSSRLDHVGYRLATLAGLPSSCTLSRVRLAEAGFHFSPSTDPSAVFCHQCPAVYSLDQAPGAPGPLEFHKSASPQCPVVRAASERDRGLTSAPASASAFASASAPVPGSGNRARGQDLSEDGEGRGPDRRTDGSMGPTSTQGSTSVAFDTGIVLALASSVVDHRYEPKVRPTPGSSRPSSSFSSSSSSSFSLPSAAVGHYETDGPSEDTGYVSLSEAVYPQFSTTQSRLVTFAKWPSVVSAFFPAQLMVDLGFHYAGYADCVRCFYCGVGLKSWDSQDDPLTEHARWRPSCGFLLATKGRQHIQRLLQRINGTSEAHAESGRSTSGGRSEEQRGSQGSSMNPSGDEASSVLQQLTTMGFASKDIDTARARLRAAGQTEDIDHMLRVLLP